MLRRTIEIGKRQIPTSRILLGVTALTSSTYIYAQHYNPESIRGLRRQTQFWSHILPIITDYYIKTSSSSPYVQHIRPASTLSTPEAREQYLTALHERHAPTVLRTILSLRGLYIKLGQVLSVTALPIPEPYRRAFRTLQSDVPGWASFETTIEPTVESELRSPIQTLFSSFEETPCGAASIGQAHRATLRSNGQRVVVKVQYPDAVWQVPADIRCVGDFLSVCVWAGAVDESAATLSYDEFARQFIAELDYGAERRNLEEVYESSLDEKAPYKKHGVVLPQVYGDYCSGKVVTMGYLPGPKFEAEAKRQLELLGIDTTKGIGEVVRNAAKEASALTAVSQNKTDSVDEATLQKRATKNSLAGVAAVSSQSPSPSWKLRASELLGSVVGVDFMLWIVRFYRQMLLWQTMSAVSAIRALSPSSSSPSSSTSPKPPSSRRLVPKKWEEWAEEHQSAFAQSKRLRLTESWIHALFDVHGHQIFQLGLFNADPHPGNILVIEEIEDGDGHGNNNAKSKYAHAQLGLIDFGQCKRLSPAERLSVAKLVLSVSNHHSDAEIATAFRSLGIRTKNDSTKFLAQFARLMFGKLRPEHLRHSWHAELHGLDRVLYFPNELSMVYRTSLLLRGLGMSLGVNCSVGEEWREHAQDLVDRQEATK